MENVKSEIANMVAFNILLNEFKLANDYVVDSDDISDKLKLKKYVLNMKQIVKGMLEDKSFRDNLNDDEAEILENWLSCDTNECLKKSNVVEIYDIMANCYRRRFE